LGLIFTSLAILSVTIKNIGVKKALKIKFAKKVELKYPLASFASPRKYDMEINLLDIQLIATVITEKYDKKVFDT
jgi:hypothetical protein